RRQDLLGEVLRCVRAGVAFAGFRDGIAAKRGSTLPAEFGARRAARPARRTFTAKGCPTLLAEDCVSLVGSAARGAVHSDGCFAPSAPRIGPPISARRRPAARSPRSRAVAPPPAAANSARAR